MEPNLAKQLANPMLVRRGELWPVQDGERGRGGAQQEKHADLAMNNSSQSKLMTFNKKFNHKKNTYKSLKSHLKCVPLLPYPFSGTVNYFSILYIIL